MASRGFEWKTTRTLFGLPLICVAFGRDERGKVRVAKGIVAVGQFAIGAVAIGQIALGFLFSFGQVVTGFLAFGQLAVGLGAAGQFAVGYIALGLVVAGVYAMGELAWGSFVWSNQRQDMEALSVFYTIRMLLSGDLFICSKIWNWACQVLPELLASPKK